jgi:hypothetical protein
MKMQNEVKKTLLDLRGRLLSAVAELDPRGTNRQTTEAMCVIEASIDAAISGKRLSARKAAKLGLAMCKPT